MITKEHNSIYVCVCIYIYIYINISGPSFEMVLESFSTRRHTFMKLYTHWRSISDHYCALFKDITIFQRECTKSGHTFCKEYHLLWKIRLGITDIGRLYVKKCQTHVLSALCLLYFVSIVVALFLNSAKFCRKLGGNRWTTKLPSTHAQVSEHLIFQIWRQEGRN